MNLEHGEGETGQNPAETILNHQITSTKDSDALAPAGGDVNHLEGAQVLA